MDIVDFGINPEIIKVSASAILGGIGFKIVERFLNAKTFVEEHTALRAELREELDTVREEVIRLRKEVDEWRERYYQQVALTNALQAELHNIRCEVDEHKQRLMSNFDINLRYDEKED
jgi:uncharacterized coiled-coil DUF342 family protein